MSAATETVGAEETVPNSTREEQALAVVKKSMAGNVAAGLIALPIVDLIAIWGIQIAMVKSVSNIYGVEFRENAVKTVLASYLGSATSMTIGYGVFRSLLKVVPGIGLIAGVAAQSVSAGAITYAIGKIYIMHFEAGGTLFNLDPQKMKTHFETLYKEGLDVAKTTVGKVQAKVSVEEKPAKS